jgi:hypothetical protein
MSQYDYPKEVLFDELNLSFDEQFAAEDIIAAETLGDVHRMLVSSMSQLPTNGGCVRHAAFNIVRTALIESTGVARKDIKLDTDLHQLIPLRFRRAWWHSLLHRIPVNVRQAHLRLPKFVHNVLGILMLVSFLGALPSLFLIQIAGMFVGIITFLSCIAIFAIGAWVFANEAENPFALRIPEGFETPRKFARELAMRNYAEIAKQRGVWNEREVWSILRETVALICYGDDEEISETTLISELPVCAD